MVTCTLAAVVEVAHGQWKSRCIRSVSYSPRLGFETPTGFRTSTVRGFYTAYVSYVLCFAFRFTFCLRDFSLGP